MHKEILEEIGEKELINRLGKFMPKNQISDDCALIKTKNDNLLVNTDSLVENVHFNDIVICCLLYTSPSPRDRQKSRMPSSA